MSKKLSVLKRRNLDWLSILCPRQDSTETQTDICFLYTADTFVYLCVCVSVGTDSFSEGQIALWRLGVSGMCVGRDGGESNLQHPMPLPCRVGEDFCPSPEPYLLLQHASLPQHRAGPRAACSSLLRLRALLCPWTH